MFDKLNLYFGRLIVALVAILPLLMWTAHEGFSPLTSSIGGLLASLGKACALSGMALYMFMPVLTMRHWIVESIFGNLSNAAKIHSRFSKISFYVILAHPILLGAGRIFRGTPPSKIWEWTGVMVVIGIIAMVAFCVLVAITIFAHIKHQSWIKVHYYFGWLIPLYFLHAILAKSQITQNEPLLIYMIVIFILGFAAFSYRTILSRYFERKYAYSVAEVRHLTQNDVEITLKPNAEPIHYLPGQYAFVSVLNNRMSPEAHPFSFTTAHNGPYVRFVIKALGDDTSQFKEIAAGDQISLEGPYGNFSYTKVKNTKQIWIAGGVGITPFLSMARSLSDEAPHSISLFYGAQKIEDAVFLQEILDIKRHLPKNFDITIVDQHISGFITTEMLRKQHPNLIEYDFLICGPPVMVDIMGKNLLQAGIPAKQVHFDAFTM